MVLKFIAISRYGLFVLRCEVMGFVIRQYVFEVEVRVEVSSSKKTRKVFFNKKNNAKNRGGGLVICHKYFMFIYATSSGASSIPPFHYLSIIWKDVKLLICT